MGTFVYEILASSRSKENEIQYVTKKLGELDKEDDTVLISKGGRGGRGNRRHNGLECAEKGGKGEVPNCP